MLAPGDGVAVDDGSAPQDADLIGHRPGGGRVVAGDQHGADPGGSAPVDHARSRGVRWVGDRDQAHPVAVLGHGEDPVALLGQPLGLGARCVDGRAGLEASEDRFQARP